MSRAGAGFACARGDKLGLTRSLSWQLAGLGQRRRGHDPGRVIRDLAQPQPDDLTTLQILDDEPRIVVLQGDQADPDSLQRAIASCPAFDVIVGDGSHIASHITTAFTVLFPRLQAGGIYAIEDLHTAYWRSYDGGPPGTPGTGVALAKDLLDDVKVGPRPIAAIHAYWGIVFIEKADKPAVGFQEPARSSGGT